MIRRIAVAATAAALLMVSLTFSVASPASAATTQNFEVTLYGWPDNSPPGDGTAFGSGHAGGTGTFANPVTFATDQSELAPGTVVYYPFLHRYFVMQDECTECDADWNAGRFHIDLWVGGQNGNVNAVINCEDALTQSSAPVIESPPSNEPVDTTPLFNSSTNTCYNPGSFTGGGGGGTGGGTAGPIHGYGGKCVDVAGANPADGTAVQLYTCNGTSAQNWTHSGNTLQALGKCMDVTAAGTANGTKVQLYDCNGTGAQAWTVGASGSLVNTGSGKCLDATGPSSANGTRLQIWSCTGAANQTWTLS